MVTVAHKSSPYNDLLDAGCLTLIEFYTQGREMHDWIHFRTPVQHNLK